MFDILKEGFLIQPQLNYLLALQSFREATDNVFDRFFEGITWVGEVIIPLTVMALIYWCFSNRAGIFLLLNSALGVVFNQLLKMSACVYRPWILSNEIHPVKSVMEMAYGYSFPSGHTTVATAVWGGMAFWFWKNKFIRYPMLILVLLIAFSRNYLGVHTPQDVLAAMLIGVCLMFFINWVLRFVNKNYNADLFVWSVLMLFTALTFLVLNLKGYPIDYLFGKILVDPTKLKLASSVNIGYAFGVFSGWILNRRFLKFNAQDGTLKTKILRFVVGAIILNLLIFLGTKYMKLWLGVSCGLFLNFLAVGLFITYLYPLIFTKIEKSISKA